MENVNVREIRRRLKHGDIAAIAERCKTHPRNVAEVLNKGRDNAGRYDEIIACALDLIKNEIKQKENIVAKAKELNLTTEAFTRGDHRKKRKFINKTGKPGGVWKVVAGLGVSVVLFLVMGGAKLFAKKQ